MVQCVKSNLTLKLLNIYTLWILYSEIHKDPSVAVSVAGNQRKIIQTYRKLEGTFKQMNYNQYNSYGITKAQNNVFFH